MNQDGKLGRIGIHHGAGALGRKTLGRGGHQPEGER
jgi:hypothetical protein